MSDARASQLAVEVLGVPQSGALVAQVSVEVLSAVPAPDARVGQVAVEVLSTRPSTESTLDPSRMVFVAEMTAAIDDAGTLATFYATDGIGWVTAASDTPANTHVQPTLTNPGTYRRELFSGNRLYGAVRPAFGAATLSNLDGRYDAWKFHGFDGRRYTVYAGLEGAAFPSAWTVVFRATIQQCDVDFREVRFKLRDDLDLLDKSILIETFAGTGGVEGDDSMVGVPKVRTIGGPYWHPVQPIILIPPVVRWESDGPTYDFGGGYAGKPTASAECGRFIATRDIRLKSTFAPSRGSARVAATGSTVFSIKVNGTEVGTMTFAASATVPTFAASSDIDLASGDVVTVVAPGTADATLEDVAYTISGYLLLTGSNP